MNGIIKAKKSRPEYQKYVYIAFFNKNSNDNFLKLNDMSKEKVLKEKSDKKAPEKNLKEKRAAKAAKKEGKKGN